MVLTLMLLLYMYVIGNYDATLEYNLAVKMMLNMVLTLMLLLYMYVIGHNDATLDYNLAVKMMFNYGLDSNAAVIYVCYR